VKTIAVVSRANALKLLAQTPGTIDILYCSSKYAPKAFPVGREIEVLDHVVAVYSNRGKDSWGPYSKLRCITPSKIPEKEPSA
jgi:hypothetical protein